ncbi:hypothetical protein E2C01_017563 [Portunus trituberculatus]|uniref:Uncharacterized protein n=1 Tax=Portunus trituberculatus TaxID=210409 RepID=A0A5B7DS36_PORTR|nr:hypothetical protein [Portunus trituberculatus]
MCHQLRDMAQKPICALKGLRAEMRNFLETVVLCIVPLSPHGGVILEALGSTWVVAAFVQGSV